MHSVYSISIDSGIDYTHPNLGGGIGDGKLVVGGYDFVGDDFDGTNTPVPDLDPLDQCDGHGTHVAGIIAMQPGNEFGVSGVAYESTLMAYRIFGCSELGQTSDDAIIAALIRAYDDGCDVITLSLGEALGWSSSRTSVVASEIAARGRVVTVATGNDGAEGAWYSESPANGLDVIAVGSVDNTEVFYNTLTVSGVAHAPIAYLGDADSTTGFAPFNLTGEWPLYALSEDLSIANDACEPLPASVPDLSKFITIIRRGTCKPASSKSTFHQFVTIELTQATFRSSSLTSQPKAAEQLSSPTTVGTSGPWLSKAQFPLL